MSADTVTMTMVQTKTTKGTVVFTESESDVEESGRSRPHTFYILKDTFGELGDPTIIDVTIERVE